MKVLSTIPIDSDAVKKDNDDYDISSNQAITNWIQCALDCQATSVLYHHSAVTSMQVVAILLTVI